MSKNIIFVLALSSLVSCTQRTVYRVEPAPVIEQVRVLPAPTVINEPTVIVREPVIVKRRGRVVERVITRP